MTIKCLAVDDEPLALKQISDYITKTPFLDLVASCKSSFEAMAIMENEKIDLLFLDIQMPDLTGMELAKSLKGDVKIIFTTAYVQYAFEGFKVSALDYLLKPIGYDDFLIAALKAKKHFETYNQNVELNVKSEYLFVKSEYKLQKIELSKILYIEGLREYVRIHLTEEKPVMSLITLKSLEEKLPSTNFMRVHRSFIVNLDQVATIERSRIVFGKVYIPVSDQYKEKFQKFIEERFI